MRHRASRALPPPAGGLHTCGIIMDIPETMTVAYQRPESEGSRVLVAEMREFPVPSIREPTELP